MKTTIALGVLAIVAIASVATATALLDTGATPAGEFYVSDNGHVYQETNNAPGLQETVTQDANGRDVPADTIVA